MAFGRIEVGRGVFRLGSRFPPGFRRGTLRYSQSNPNLTQDVQRGNPSSHFTRRLLQVVQPFFDRRDRTTVLFCLVSTKVSMVRSRLHEKPRAPSGYDPTSARSLTLRFLKHGRLVLSKSDVDLYCAVFLVSGTDNEQVPQCST